METTDQTQQAETTTYVSLDPEQLHHLAEVSQGNTYALVGMLFCVIAVLVGIFLTTLMR